MSLDKYLQSKKISNEDFIEIVSLADKGLSLKEIHGQVYNEVNGISMTSIYALVHRYCMEGSGNTVTMQYPAIAADMLEILEKKRADQERDQTIRHNKEILAEFEEDLSNLKRELGF